MLKSCAKAPACLTTMNEIERLCAIWYHLYNLKDVKNSHGGVLLLAKLQAKACNFTKRNTAPWVFSCFLNCINSTKSRKGSHISTVPRLVRHGSSTINQVDFPSSGQCSVSLPYFLTLQLYLVRIGDICRLINLR